MLPATFFAETRNIPGGPAPGKAHILSLMLQALLTCFKLSNVLANPSIMCNLLSLHSFLKVLSCRECSSVREKERAP